MSLKYHDFSQVPADTARVAKSAYPKGCAYMTLRDKLGPIFADEHFAPLYKSPRGRPAEAPAVLAMALVLEFKEDISDTMVAHMVAGRIDWKYLLGLPLDAPGFDASILCDFRARVIAGGLESEFLDRILEIMKEQGLLKKRGNQRTDSTHVLAYARHLNRLELVGESMVHALNTLAMVVPEWLESWVPPDWYTRYGQSFENYRLPRERQEREKLSQEIGEDGQQLLAVCYAAESPRWLREIPAVETLRQVWLQQYYVEEGCLRFRSTKAMPPHSEQICSPYETEARYKTKRKTHWVGYKVHVTETCEPNRPHLITHVATTLSTTDDGEVTPHIHEALAARDLLPGEHFVDMAYIDTHLLVESREDFEVELMGSLREDPSWQARREDGFDIRVFAIDWQARQVRCPQGVLSSSWSESKAPAYEQVIHVRFPRAQCHACPAREHCTRSKSEGRTLTFFPQLFYDAQQERRRAQKTAEFREKYKSRAGVEGTISQGTRSFGMRRARYRGQKKTHLQHICTAVAMNFARLADWWDERKPAKTRRSRFAALAPALA